MEGRTYSASFLFSVNFASATWDAVKVSDLTMALFGCIRFYGTLITFTSLVLSSGWSSKTHFMMASSESIVAMLCVFSKPQDRPNEITQPYVQHFHIQHFQSLYYANWYQTTIQLYSHIAMTYHIKNIKSSK